MSNAVELSSVEARLAAIGGTRQMIHEDEFSVLVALLVDCGAIPRNIMASTLRGLAGGLIEKARGELETDWVVYPAEAFDRARALDQLAGKLLSGADGRTRVTAPPSAQR